MNHTRNTRINVSLSNPTGRKTEARCIEIGDTELYFSYNTLIAVRSPNGRYRLPNHWGPTTGRHFNELGCGNFEIVDELPDMALRVRPLAKKYRPNMPVQAA